MQISHHDPALGAQEIAVADGAEIFIGEAHFGRKPDFIPRQQQHGVQAEILDRRIDRGKSGQQLGVGFHDRAGFRQQVAVAD